MVIAPVHGMRVILGFAVMLCLGCNGKKAEEGPDFSKLLPVRGTVALNGKPLVGAVVTFLPKSWGAAVGETDANGQYSLEYGARPGVPPGPYKVSVSLLISTDGQTQGLAPRSALYQPPSMVGAKEVMPPEYADLGRSKLTAEVKEGAKSFDFEIKVPGLELKKTTEAADKPSEPSKKS